jgi:hypothetical protein
MGRVRGLAEEETSAPGAGLPITFPSLRDEPLPLPQGEREDFAIAIIVL